MRINNAEDSSLGASVFKAKLLHPSNWLTWIALFVFFFVTLLPLRLIDSIGCRLGLFALNKNAKRRNIVLTNLRLCYPDKTESEIEHMARQHFQQQYRSLMHYFLLWWRPQSTVDNKIIVEGFEQLENIQQQDKQVIVLLSHNVGLDFAVAALSMRAPVVGIYKQIRDPVVEWLVARSRIKFGKKHHGRLFVREQGMRPLIREVRAGKVMVYLADEDLGEKHSIFAPFFGVQKATLPMLGRLAKTCNAIVLPCVCCYEAEHKKYRVKLFPPLQGMPSGDDLCDSKTMNKSIEQLVNYCPLQYLWTLRYFQTRPPGENSVYD